LSYADQPDASEAVFDTPDGETITVPVRQLRNEYVALIDHARKDGFYLARVSLQAPGLPIAVNVDTAESDVASLSPAETASAFAESGITVAQTDDDLLAAVGQARAGVSFWMLFLFAGLGLLVIESLLAKRMRASGGGDHEA
jgi:hypothetical protein